MSRWALILAVAGFVAGCTRLNGAFDDGHADTDAPTRGTGTSTSSTGVTGEPGLETTRGPDSATGPSSLTDAPLTTQGPTDADTGSETSTGGELCFTVFDSEVGCELYSEDPCRDGECRPYGDEEGLTDIGCVEQPPEIALLRPGDACTHACGGLLGADGCPPGSICDPFAAAPTCVEFCNPAEDFPCGGDSSCFEHFAGREPYGLCRVGCNPLSNNCPDGQSCFPLKEGNTCQQAGGLGQGDGCKLLNDCGFNLACATEHDPGCDGPSCCVELCSLRLDDCAPGYTCLEFEDGGEIVGGCAFDE